MLMALRRCAHLVLVLCFCQSSLLCRRCASRHCVLVDLPSCVQTPSADADETCVQLFAQDEAERSHRRGADSPMTKVRCARSATEYAARDVAIAELV